jgi:hypothetical protein
MMKKTKNRFFVFLAQNRKIFAEQDAERAMIYLLLSENDEVRIAACQALAVMAESMLSRETIRNNGLFFILFFFYTIYEFRWNSNIGTNDAKR